MKKYVKKHPLPTFFLLSLLAIFLLPACAENDADAEAIALLVGNWEHTERSIDNVVVAKDSTRLFMHIDINQICELHNKTAAAANTVNSIKRSGWSYAAGVLNIAVDLPASWVTKIESDKLSMERRDFSKTGTLITTVLKYERRNAIDNN